MNIVSRNATLDNTRFFRHATYGQRVAVETERAWGVVRFAAILVDKFNSSDGTTAAKLYRPEDGSTLWVTGESIIGLGSMTTFDFVKHLSSVMCLPVVIENVTVWHWNQQHIGGMEGEIEGVAVDTEDDYILVFVEGQRDFQRYHRKFVTIHEEALDAEYDQWLDDMELEAAIG
jgi:hypothetical protein